MLYLDANATTPPDPAVIEAMLPWLRDEYANPSGTYRSGRLAHEAIEKARSQVAALIHAQPEEIIFTSGGTESNNAVLHAARQRWPQRSRLIIGATEHPAVMEPALRWQQEGGLLTILPVNDQGLPDLESLRATLAANDTALVSVMWANNETGVIAPIAEITALAHEAGALCHTDAVQAAGKLPVDVTALPVDYLSLSAHKLHGPKGIGALYIHRHAPFQPLLLGGGQEQGRRSGTENVPAIAGFGVAAELVQQHNAQDLSLLRDTLERHLPHGAIIHGREAPRLPNTSSFALPGLDAAAVLLLLDRDGLALSAGSACHSASAHPSPVLQAMGFDAAHAASTLRVSFSRVNTPDDAIIAAHHLAAAADMLRSWQQDGPVKLAE